MKQLWTVVVPVLFLGLILIGCGENSDTQKNLAPTGSVQVSSNVFDDEQSTAYIRVDNPMMNRTDVAVAEIMMKKRAWEKWFPNKKIVTMSIITGNALGSYYGNPAVVGLLIHYEER